jgi:hypothetical protein
MEELPFGAKGALFFQRVQGALCAHLQPNGEIRLNFASLDVIERCKGGPEEAPRRPPFSGLDSMRGY